MNGYDTIYVWTRFKLQLLSLQKSSLSSKQHYNDNMIDEDIIYTNIKML